MPGLEGRVPVELKFGCILGKIIAIYATLNDGFLLWMLLGNYYSKGEGGKEITNIIHAIFTRTKVTILNASNININMHS